MKVSSKHYILIVLAIISIIISGFGYWYVYNAIVEQAEARSKALKEIDLEKVRKASETEVVKTYNETKVDRSRLSALFLYEDKIVNFIEAVESIGTNSGTDLVLSTIKIDGGHVKSHIEAKGSWANITRALILIENLPYSLSINNVRLIASNKQWNLSLDIEVLTLKKEI